MTVALKRLGYVPYTLKSAFQGANVRTHPERWSALLDNQERLKNLHFLRNYDSLVGPPGSVLYDEILKLCPPFTKVILIEEPCKEQWAERYETYVHRMLSSSRCRSLSRHRIGLAFYNMVEKMIVCGGLPRDSLATKPQSSSSQTAPRGSNLDRAEALEEFEKSVRLGVPKSRLLVYRYSDGWEPLCRFLGVRVPHAAFPPLSPADACGGLDGLSGIEDRLERVRLLHRLVYCIVACGLVFLLKPHADKLWANLRSVREEYRLAYDDKQ